MRSMMAIVAAALVAGCSGSSSGTNGTIGTSGVTGSNGTSGGATSAAASSGSSSGGATGGGSATGAAGGTSSGTGGPPVFSVTFPPITVPVGGELTQCVVVSLGNAAAVHIGEIHSLLPTGAYDFVIYRSSDAQAQPTPFDCPTFGNIGAAPADSALSLSHKADDDVILPAGVGLTLLPNQLLRLELHAVNYGAADAPVSASATLFAMADTVFQSEAAFVLLGDPDINLPPQSDGDRVQGFVLIPSTVAPADAEWSQMSGYAHKAGADVTAATSSSSSGPLTTVYDPPSWAWDDSARVDGQPPVQLPQGGGGFQITCTYNNDTNGVVRLGQSYHDEECLFQAYANPASGAFVCLHSDQFGVDVCCPTGDAGCTLFH